VSTMPSPSRRAVLRGAGLAAVTVGAAAACGSGGTDDTSAASSATTSTSAGASSSSSAGGSGGAELASVADVPVGGGMVVAAQKVVLTQPKAGEIKAFSTRCTHQGCAVSSVQDGFIVCPCHNSRFAIADGAPTPDSPAKQPLAGADVTVSGDKITLA
jgi:Rieske Fe-S protein